MTTHPTAAARSRWRALAAAACLGLLTACSPAAPSSPTPPPAGPGSTAASTPTPSEQPTLGDPVLQALQKGIDPNTAAGLLIRSPGTTVKEHPLDWAKGWKVYDLENGVGHPQRMFIALGDDGTALRLSNVPENVNKVSQGSPVADAAAAARRASDFFELARNMRVTGYPVSAIDDIDWLPQPNADQKSAQERLVAKYRSVIQPPAATANGDGWVVTLWRVEDQSLVKHSATVARSGQVTDAAETVESNLPIPKGI